MLTFYEVDNVYLEVEKLKHQNYILELLFKTLDFSTGYDLLLNQLHLIPWLNRIVIDLKKQDKISSIILNIVHIIFKILQQIFTTDVCIHPILGLWFLIYNS